MFFGCERRENAAAAVSLTSTRLVRRRRHRLHRRRPVTAVLLLVDHGVEFLRLVRVQRQQLVDHLSDGRVLPDPRVRVHGRLVSW